MVFPNVSFKFFVEIFADPLEYDIIENINGPSYVYLDYLEGNKKVTFRFKKSTSLKVEEKLKEYINIGSK